MGRKGVLFLAGCLVAALSINGTGQSTQTSAAADLPIVSGDNLTLHYQQVLERASVTTVTCTVVAVRGTFVKCQPAGDSSFRDASGERWRNLAFVMEIVKHSPR